ncbi:MAG: hypothetical protein ACRDXX_09845 [Stackebrandtia sp.]
MKSLNRMLLGAAVAATFALSGCGAGQQAQTDSMVPSVPGVNDQIVNDDKHIYIALRDVVVVFDAAGYAAGEDAPLVVRIFNTGRESDRLIGVESPIAESAALVDPDAPVEDTAEGEAADEGEEADSAEAEDDAESAEGEPAEDESAEGEGEDAAEDEEGEAGEDAQADDADDAEAEAAEEDAAAPEDFGGDVKSGGYLLLDPAVGVHLVLENLSEEIKPGGVVPITFTFAEAGSIELQVPVGTPMEPEEREHLELEEAEGH